MENVLFILLSLIAFKSNSDSYSDRRHINLKGTKWTHNVGADCMDSLVFTSTNRGHEYRCEFEMANNFKYTCKNDTLILYELGLVSQTEKSLGEEIKYRWEYVYSSDKLILTGYATGLDGTMGDTKRDIVYRIVGP